MASVSSTPLPESGFSWRRVWSLFDAHRPTVLLVLGLVLATSILGVINPLLIKIVFDDALFPGDSAGPNVTLLVVLCVVMIVIAVAGGALGVYQTFVTNRLGQSVLRDLRDRVYRHLQSLSLSRSMRAREPATYSRGSRTTSVASKPR